VLFVFVLELEGEGEVFEGEGEGGEETVKIGEVPPVPKPVASERTATNLPADLPSR
jgi:hypothetical protein